MLKLRKLNFDLNVINVFKVYATKVAKTKQIVYVNCKGKERYLTRYQVPPNSIRLKMPPTNAKGSILRQFSFKYVNN